MFARQVALQGRVVSVKRPSFAELAEVLQVVQYCGGRRSCMQPVRTAGVVENPPLGRVCCVCMCRSQ